MMNQSDPLRACTVCGHSVCPAGVRLCIHPEVAHRGVPVAVVVARSGGVRYLGDPVEPGLCGPDAKFHEYKAEAA